MSLGCVAAGPSPGWLGTQAARKVLAVLHRDQRPGKQVGVGGDARGTVTAGNVEAGPDPRARDRARPATTAIRSAGSNSWCSS